MVGAHRGYQNDLTLGTNFLFMSGVIYYASAILSYPYQTKQSSLTDRTSDSETDPRIVMAEQISQDVVKQEQSVDGPPSTDVSATEPTNTPARAALEKTSAYPTNENDHTSSSSRPEDLSENQESKDIVAAQSEFATDPRAAAVSLRRRYVTEANGGEGDSTVNDLDGVSPKNRATNDHLNTTELQESEATDNDSARGTGVEGSIGSDTEFSKADISDATGKELGDGQEQTRPNAVKKSTSFKPVSVTKNFLAKAGTATTPIAKTSTDKGT